MPMREAIFPRRWMRSMSSAVRASSKVSGYLATIWWTTSICSNTAWTAAGPAGLGGHQVYGCGSVTLRRGIRLLAAGGAAGARALAWCRYPNCSLGLTQLALAGQSSRAVSEPLVSQSLLDGPHGSRLSLRTGTLSHREVILLYSIATHSNWWPCSWLPWPCFPSGADFLAGRAPPSWPPLATGRCGVRDPGIFQYRSPLPHPGGSIRDPGDGVGAREFLGSAAGAGGLPRRDLLAQRPQSLLRSERLAHPRSAGACRFAPGTGIHLYRDPYWRLCSEAVHRTGRTARSTNFFFCRPASGLFRSEEH